MKVMTKMVGILVLIMLLTGSASVVAANSANANNEGYGVTIDDDPTDEDVPDWDEEIPDWDDEDVIDIDTENVAVVLHGTGTLFAMGSGEVKLRGSGKVLIFGEDVTVVVSNHAWIRAFGEWTVESQNDGRAKYTGSGVLQIHGRHISVLISGDDISLKASGTGSAILKGDWKYWFIRRPPYKILPYPISPCECSVGHYNAMTTTNVAYASNCKGRTVANVARTSICRAKAVSGIRIPEPLPQVSPELE